MTRTCSAQRLHNANPDDDFAGDVRMGLSRQPKRLPLKYFYDARGSELFEQICEVPEYYLTPVELAILRRYGSEIAETIGTRPLIIEYGSGSGIKTRLLLGALSDPVGYVPIEMSRSALTQSIEALTREFVNVEMLPVCADFTRAITVPRTQRRQRRVVVFFPGSTLGNFETHEAIDLLRNMRMEMGVGGAALIGIDLKKDCATMEAAYNDGAGITRSFTLNLLVRINRELDGDFDLAQFSHRAIYNPMAGRIETYIVSHISQRVHVDSCSVAFEANEAMLVEYSYKYEQSKFEETAAKAGLRAIDTWTDPQCLFAIQLLQQAPSHSLPEARDACET